jgi:hypothetical protein
MPLLDHFHPPLESRHHWDSFHSNWATRLADQLNERLPEGFMAEEQTHGDSRLEIDVATFEETDTDKASQSGDGNATTTVSTPTWTPTLAPRSMPAVFPESYEIRVFSTSGGLTLVGAIELVSPGNKDRLEERRAFAIKCASYLIQGISLIILDVVTNRRANLHNEAVRLLSAGAEFELPAETSLYAVAYRPVLRQERAQVDFWSETLTVGAELPTMPLRLTGDLFVPVDFEAAYEEARRRRRWR